MLWKSFLTNLFKKLNEIDISVEEKLVMREIGYSVEKVYGGFSFVGGVMLKK